jgi:hypothetical protein
VDVQEGRGGHLTCSNCLESSDKIRQLIESRAGVIGKVIQCVSIVIAWSEVS